MTLVCNSKNNTINIGDTSDVNKCLRVPLSGGGTLLVNKDNMSDLSRAIGLFSPEDINRIMRAIATDQKAQEELNKIEDDTNSVGDSADASIGNEDYNSGVETIVNDSTRCTTKEADGEKTWHITMYTEEGISCTSGKAGEMKAMWEIRFTDSRQHDRVMNFVNSFDSNDNLTFASNEKFWKDYMSGNIDEEDFVSFYEQTNNGVIDNSMSSELVAANIGYVQYF